MFHEKHKIPEPDEQAQFKFDQGYLVGDLAKSLFKNGIEGCNGRFIYTKWIKLL